MHPGDELRKRRVEHLHARFVSAATNHGSLFHLAMHCDDEKLNLALPQSGSDLEDNTCGAFSHDWILAWRQRTIEDVLHSGSRHFVSPGVWDGSWERSRFRACLPDLSGGHRLWRIPCSNLSAVYWSVNAHKLKVDQQVWGGRFIGCSDRQPRIRRARDDFGLGEFTRLGIEAVAEFGGTNEMVAQSKPRSEEEEICNWVEILYNTLPREVDKVSWEPSDETVWVPCEGCTVLVAAFPWNLFTASAKAIELLIKRSTAEDPLASPPSPPHVSVDHGRSKGVVDGHEDRTKLAQKPPVRPTVSEDENEAAQHLAEIQQRSESCLSETSPGDEGDRTRLKRFEVWDVETGKSKVFDEADTERRWHICEFEWDNVDPCPTFELQITLYRHRSGLWTLLTKRIHAESGFSDPPEAHRLTDTEAADWLVRHDFEAPPDVARLAADTFFQPGEPGNERGIAAVTTPADCVWFLLFRPSALVRTAQEADSGCASPDEWEVFCRLEDLTPDEVRVVLDALEAEFRGPIGDTMTTRGALYEFDAKQESELVQEPASYVRLRRAWKVLHEEYELADCLLGPIEIPNETCWQLHRCAIDFAEDIRARRGTGQPFSASDSGVAAQRKREADEKAAADTGAPPEPKPRLTVDTESCVAQLDGKPYPLTAEQARFVHLLVEADGDWRSAKGMEITKSDRLKRAMPEPIQNLIESIPGKGSRIPRALLLRKLK